MRFTHLNPVLATALIYNGINSTIDLYRGNVHDVYGSMTAAALTGVIWRSTGAFPLFCLIRERGLALTHPILCSRRQVDGGYFRSPDCGRSRLDLVQDAASLRRASYRHLVSPL